MSVLCYIAVAAAVVFLIFGEHASEAATVKKAGRKHTNQASKPKVLWLSIGGFRGDYLTNLNLTNIDQMIRNGTKAKYVQNSMNVLDIVDHYSVATGLYPESHGIISNIMYDPKLDRVFNSKTREDPEWWDNVHPIWHEIEDQGQGKSALCNWPGVYGPMVPHLHCDRRQEDSLQFEIEQALHWLQEGVDLVLLYSDQIKNAAVKWGPYSRRAINEVKKFDSIMKYVLDNTRDLNVNILLTSDSGVTELNNLHIDLDQCLAPKSYVLTQPQGTLLIYPKNGYTVEELYQNLTGCNHVKVYRKEELPQWFHFSNNSRIPPLIAFVPLGAVVQSHLKSAGSNMGGTGYHPGFEVMRGVFIGYGPSFKQGLKFQAMKNVDIYGLVCHLLGINPRPNNGSYEVVKSMFSDMTSFADDPEPAVAIVPDVITPGPNSTAIPILSNTQMLEGVKILFWVLVVVTSLLLFFCCVGCFSTMYFNQKQAYAHKTRVHAPGTKSLLSDNSSDEE
jgi:ectonucleotide pyrophosphatase/phosphodiesterase family protein 5